MIRQLIISLKSWKQIISQGSGVKIKCNFWKNVFSSDELLTSEIQIVLPLREMSNWAKKQGRVFP